MKIAIYLDGKKHGGVDTHLLAMLQNWPNREDCFSIFHNHDSEGVKTNRPLLERISNVKLISYKRFYLNRFFVFSFIFSFLILFYQFLRGCYLLKIHGKFDALLSDNGGFPGASSCSAVIFSSYCLKIPKRVLLIHHAAMPKMPIFNLFGCLRDIGLQRCVTDLVTVSLATRTTLVERRQFNTILNPIHVIPNGINSQDGIVPSDINLRGKYNIKQDEFIIGIIGRVDRYKGQEDLIIAVSRLPEEIRVRFKVLIVGGGDSAEITRLKSIINKHNIEDRIIFTGFIDSTSVEIIKCFNVLLMLTKDFEAFNYTIAEAMIVGVPTIITDVGAIREYYNGEISKIVPPESPDMVCEAITEYAEDPSLYSIRADKAKIHIQKFSATRMAFGYYDLIS